MPSNVFRKDIVLHPGAFTNVRRPEGEHNAVHPACWMVGSPQFTPETIQRGLSTVSNWRGSRIVPKRLRHRYLPIAHFEGRLESPETLDRH